MRKAKIDDREKMFAHGGVIQTTDQKIRKMNELPDVFYGDKYPLQGCRIEIDIVGFQKYTIRVYPPGRTEPMEYLIASTTVIVINILKRILRF